MTSCTFSGRVLCVRGYSGRLALDDEDATGKGDGNLVRKKAGGPSAQADGGNRGLRPRGKLDRSFWKPVIAGRSRFSTRDGVRRDGVDVGEGGNDTGERNTETAVSSENRDPADPPLIDSLKKTPLTRSTEGESFVQAGTSAPSAPNMPPAISTTTTTKTTATYPVSTDNTIPPGRGTVSPPYPPLFTTYPSTLGGGSTGTALADQRPTPSSASSTSNGFHHDHDGPSGLNPTAEHLLISAGSIGAFLLVCFICWVIWRMTTKTRIRREEHDAGLSDKFRNRVPFLRERGWEEVMEDDRVPLGPPSYREKVSFTGMPTSMAGVYGQDKAVMQQRQQLGVPEVAPPQFPGMAGLSRSGTMDSRFSMTNNGNTMNSVTFGTLVNGTGSAHTLASEYGPLSRRGQGSFDSNTGQFGSFDSASGPNGPSYNNQLGLARSTSDGFGPARRQMNRASELSSLSSGFGDGDIVVPELFIKPPPAASINVRQSTTGMGRRFSWMSRGGSSRDTVYTESSEDSPPRFRSVTSWVNQQAGRVKRGQLRAEAAGGGDDDDPPPVPQLPGQLGVPGMHNPPAEQSFTLMMHDGETPRPVESTLAAADAFKSGGNAASTASAAGMTRVSPAL